MAVSYYKPTPTHGGHLAIGLFVGGIGFLMIGYVLFFAKLFLGYLVLLYALFILFVGVFLGRLILKYYTLNYQIHGEGENATIEIHCWPAKCTLPIKEIRAILIIHGSYVPDVKISGINLPGLKIGTTFDSFLGAKIPNRLFLTDMDPMIGFGVNASEMYWISPADLGGFEKELKRHNPSIQFILPVQHRKKKKK